MRSDRKLKTLHQKPITIKAQLRKARTLDDLFAQDKINEILNEVNEKKTDITRLAVIFETSDEIVHYRTNNLDQITFAGLLEFAKSMEFSNDED